MSDPTLPHGQLPPIPDGCGILPIAENRIARGPHPEILDLPPEGFSSSTLATDAPLPELDDALEQSYRRVLSRALALAAASLLFAALVATTLGGTPTLPGGVQGARAMIRTVLILQVVFTGLCGKYVEKLSIVPAAILLFAYAGFFAMELSVLLPPTVLAVALVCAGAMYALTSAWGFMSNADLARPLAALFMLVAGGVLLALVNLALHARNLSWTLSSIAVTEFALLAMYFGQRIRDFYQDFDDDNAQGWKASVLGALVLLLNAVNVYLLAAAFLSRPQDDSE